MKNYLVVLFLVAFTACKADKKQMIEPNSFTIVGDAKGIPDQKVYLELKAGEEMKVQEFEPVQIVNGKFKFEGTLINPPAIISFRFEDSKINVWKNFIIENSAMSFSIEQKSEDNQSFFEAKLTGSTSNDEYEKFSKGLNDISKETILFASIYRTLGDNGKLPKDQWSDDDLAQAEKMEKQSKESEIKRNKYLLDAGNCDNDLTKLFAIPMLYHWSALSFNTPKLCEATFNKLEASLTTSHIRQYYSSEISRKAEYSRLKAEVSVGNPYKNFTQNNQNGKPITASEILKSNKYILLDFWASWCGPCRKENPNLLKAYHKYKDQGFDVLAISIDDNKEAWLNAIKKDKMPWTQLSDIKGRENLVAKLYSVSGIPASFLINSEGTIIATDLRGEALDKKLEELFK